MGRILTIKRIIANDSNFDAKTDDEAEVYINQAITVDVDFQMDEVLTYFLLFDKLEAIEASADPKAVKAIKVLNLYKDKVFETSKNEIKMAFHSILTDLKALGLITDPDIAFLKGLGVISTTLAKQAGLSRKVELPEIKRARL